MYDMSNLNLKKSFKSTLYKGRSLMNSKEKTNYGFFGIDTIIMAGSIIYFIVVMIILNSCHNPLSMEINDTKNNRCEIGITHDYTNFCDNNCIIINNEIDNEIQENNEEVIEENEIQECNHEWWYENRYNENIPCICGKNPNEHIEYGMPNFEYYRTEEIYFHRTAGTGRVTFDVLDLNNLLKSIYDYLNELDFTIYAGFKSWRPETTLNGGGYYHGSYTRNNFDMFIEGKNDDIKTLEDFDNAPNGIYYNGQLIFVTSRGKSSGIISNFKVTLYKEVEIPSIEKISYSF